MANHNNQAHNGGMYGGQVAVPAGHHSDLQLMMRDMDTLSNFLQKNREDWLQLQEGLARVERMHGRLARESLQKGDSTGQQQQQQHQQQQQQRPADATSPTNDNNTTNNNVNNNLDDPSNPTISALQTSLSQAQSHIVSLEQTLAQDKELLTLYEDSLAEATEKIRTYIFTQQTSLSQLHKTYADLLEQARWETVQAQLTHQAWQENLGRVSEKVREAVRMREVEGRPYRGRIAALKSENRLLRRMVGWEVAAESEDEDEMGEGSAAGASGAGVEGSGVGLAAAVAAAQERAAAGGSAGLGEEGGHRQPLFGDGRVGMRDLSI